MVQAHSAEAPAAISTHVRRRNPVSTTGDHKKYQTLGIAEIATTLAMRSTGTPCLRSKNGIRTVMTALKVP